MEDASTLSKVPYAACAVSVISEIAMSHVRGSFGFPVVYPMSVDFVVVKVESPIHP